MPIQITFGIVLDNLHAKFYDLNYTSGFCMEINIIAA